MKENRQGHWEHVYATKSSNEVSWTQTVPQTSLNFIHSFNLPKDAKIIDIGGGDSNLVDHLLNEGYRNISVLDISEAALNRAKMRLGPKANLVTWIVSEITEFKPSEIYDVWHDRATFHFLTTQQQIASYISIARNAVKRNLIVGTFSENGPEKCSGLSVNRYSKLQLEQVMSNGFQKLKCINEDHITPFNTVQNFIFCSFERCYT
ncbi:class I SAM-dependent methyltransferase [Mucilaginibacter sp. P25]|uniref:Methyltransferase domain-containing protein n=1 Tax=Mucilaginibacter gossypii TaxID=551996 RepID=A0A1G7WLT8_9SPHI|nr:class I SAM-dependent methyltransferase [Mucilaginibacter gossypii]SDG72818.1 Methyltransferase domain-containing protein [Mucilaginibacter gossypii]